LSGNVLIYTANILAASETFIRDPALAFQRYTPYFLGSLRVDGLSLPQEQIITANGRGLIGRIRQALYLRVLGNTGMMQLASKLRKLEPFLLQAHYGHTAVHVIELSQKLNIPLVVYYHGLDATLLDAHAARRSYFAPYLKKRDMLKQQATLFLTQSNFLKSQLIRQGFPEEKVCTHYIGTETSGAAPPPLHQRENMVLFVARLTKKKGGRYLINAMSHIQEQHPNMKLVIVGEGPARLRLEQQTQAQLRNYQFIGWQTPQQVAEWMQRARIFCVPSVQAPSGDSEGFGMVFIEAQRWGTPVVSFAHGGIVESVADGQTGLLAPEGDTKALVQNLQRLIEDDDLWQQYSQAGYQRVRQHFDVRTLAAQLESIYDEIIEKYPDHLHSRKAYHKI